MYRELKIKFIALKTRRTMGLGRDLGADIYGVGFLLLQLIFSTLLYISFSSHVTQWFFKIRSAIK